MAAEKSGRSKKSAWVHCPNGHGIERMGIRGMVRVGMPNGKQKRRFGGCPFCRAEQK